jgi:endonuclease/exonuclease/phosphatase family metal-dependent hydrolase
MALPDDLSVASYNIHKGVGTDRRRDLMRTVAVMSEIGADILALQEADTRFGTRKGLLDLDSIRRDLGLIAVPLDGVGDAHGWHGNLLLVRSALVQHVHQLILPGLKPRGAPVTDIMIKDQPLRVVNAHFGLLPASRAALARALIDKICSMDAMPTLLMGELNEWRGGGGGTENPRRTCHHSTSAPEFSRALSAAGAGSNDDVVPWRTARYRHA